MYHEGLKLGDSGANLHAKVIPSSSFSRTTGDLNVYICTYVHNPHNIHNKPQYWRFVDINRVGVLSTNAVLPPRAFTSS